MAHLIMDSKKFYSRGVPAWHRLGTVSQKDESVQEVAERMGIPLVTLETVESCGQLLNDYRSIMGRCPDPKTGDMRLWCYGMVSDHYQLIDHQQFLNIYAECVPSHVETMGVLMNGEKLFVTTKLPSFDIQGEEILNHLLAVNTCDGKSAIQARPTSTRVVCWNTLSKALREQVELQFDGRHLGRNLIQRLRDFLSDVWDSHTEKLAIMKEAYNLLAETSTSDARETYILNAVYPIPEKPITADTDILERWETKAMNQATHRRGALALFHDSPNNGHIRGTLWSAYNGCVEYEQYARKGSGARSIVFGEGSLNIQRAFTACMEAVAV